MLTDWAKIHSLSWWLVRNPRQTGLESRNPRTEKPNSPNIKRRGWEGTDQTKSFDHRLPPRGKLGRCTEKETRIFSTTDFGEKRISRQSHLESIAPLTCHSSPYIPPLWSMPTATGSSEPRPASDALTSLRSPSDAAAPSDGPLKDPCRPQGQVQSPEGGPPKATALSWLRRHLAPSFHHSALLPAPLPVLGQVPLPLTRS